MFKIDSDMASVRTGDNDPVTVIDTSQNFGADGTNRNTTYKCTLQGVPIVPTNKHTLQGIVLLNHLLYVLHNFDPQVKVYDVNTRQMVRKIMVDGLYFSTGLVADPVNNCLCINNYDNNSVHVLSLSDDKQRVWMKKKRADSSSLTPNGELLLLCNNTIQGYSTTYDLRVGKEIQLNLHKNDCPNHAIQLTDGTYVICIASSVCNKSNSRTRVQRVNSGGDSLNSYGNTKGSSAGQLKSPDYVAIVDNEVLVADHDNNKVMRFSQTLDYIGDIQFGDYQLDKPYRICYDASSNLLCIGEKSGRVLIKKL